MSVCIHVIDPDYRRRARISRELNTWNLRVDIYENLSEFCHSNPNDGFVFAADDGENCTPAELVNALQESGTPLPVVIYANRPTTE